MSYNTLALFPAVATVTGLLASLHISVSTDMFQKVKSMLLKQMGVKADDASNLSDKDDELRPRSATLTSVNSAKVEKPSTSHPNPVHTQMFHRAHKGMFFGILAFTATILSVIFFHVNNDDEPFVASIIYHSTDLVLSSLMLCATVSAAVKLRHLGRCPEKFNSIDNILLMISMSGFILLHVFILVSGFYYLGDKYDLGRDLFSSSSSESSDAAADDDDVQVVAIVEVTATLVETIQCFAQTLLVIDAMQRYAKTRQHEIEMIGRGSISFLIIANVAMWIYKTMVIKDVLLHKHLDFYGDTAWPIILSLCLPLQLFFFFHSSVCLAEVWSEAFKQKPETLIETRQVLA